MARKKKEAGAGEEGDAPPDKTGRKSNLVPAIILAVGLLGGGYLMSSGGQAKAVAPAPGGPAGAVTTTTAPLGVIVKLDSITLNLADGRFLKIGLALQLSKKGDPAKMVTDSAKALDLAISILGSKTYADLTVPGGRDKAKQELTVKVRDAYEGKVVGIYFTEFVMQ